MRLSQVPGAKMVSEYLEVSGLQEVPDVLGFNPAGDGCITCIGNLGPLPRPTADAVNDGVLIEHSMLSDNRCSDGRVNR